MGEENQLERAYNQTAYKLAGNGERNIQVLKDASAAAIYGSRASNGVKMAVLLGKKDAVFFPSGTMAQQIALRIWCDEKGTGKVAYHPLSHLEIHEEGGLKELHHIDSVFLTERDQVIDLNDVIKMEDGVAAILLELPQREIGGQLPSFETLEQISQYCRDRQILFFIR